MSSQGGPVLWKLRVPGPQQVEAPGLVLSVTDRTSEAAMLGGKKKEFPAGGETGQGVTRKASRGLGTTLPQAARGEL